MKRLVLALAMLSGAAHAEFMSGNELLSRMSETSSYFHQGTAMGYIMGVYDATLGTTHCPPPNVTAGQIFDMVKQNLTAAPAARHLSADSFVTYSLSKAWPCKKGSGV